MTPHNASPADMVSRTSLPTAAQTWLDKALPKDFEPPMSIQIEQEGSMNIRGRWTPFKASGVYKASPLSFNWQARLSMLPGVWIVAEDGHRDGRGWGSARLWGKISIGRRTDPEVLVTQMIRNLGELPWLPSFVLLDSELKWTGVYETSFRVWTNVGDQEVMVRFEIDDQGDVIRAYSPSRPYDIPGGYAEAPWTYEFSDHRDFSGVRIPAAAIATFDKDDGSWEYFRCNITSVNQMAGQ